MNHLPRRPPRIKQPRRGKIAAVPPFEQHRIRLLPIAPPRPPIARIHPDRKPADEVEPSNDSLIAKFLELIAWLREYFTKLLFGDR
jgi:hypothetical protein